MKLIAIIVLGCCLLMLSGCIMPDPEAQIAANEVKLAEEGYEALSPGDEAPAFSATTQDGEEFKLSSALDDGPVVLFFYPANFTPNSTFQLKQLSRLQGELEEAGQHVSILAVNPAPAEETRRYLEEEGINIPVLHDEGLEISEDYGCASTEGGTQMQERTVVGISEEGTVAFYQRRFFLHSPTVKLLSGADYLNLPSS